ncbi:MULTISPECIES: lytic transglycosylase domain-containing protein [Actinomadura]|uniref:Lytic transglycosylase domain-containing protein n=2 Tax=Actinomadura yumaensis TaxID=111807 RepID=A0ABW2CBH7_9ACTN|nr:lytic transglycosylase domain-containing protein [Actinomadura sp. J1-007]
MFGDRPGSPRRDDRQSFDSPAPLTPSAQHDLPGAPHDAEGAPFDLAGAPAGAQEPFGGPLDGPGAPHEDDVKVAGSPFATRVVETGEAGDTASFGSVPGEGAAPRDEIASGGRPASGRQRRLGDGRRRPAGAKKAAAPGSGGAARRTGVKIAAVAAGAAVVVGGGAVGAFALTGSGGDSGAATVKPGNAAPLADAAQPQVDPKVMEAQRRQQALARANRSARKSAKSPKLQAKGHPIPTKKPKPKNGSGGGGSAVPAGDPVPAGEAQAIAKSMLPGFNMNGPGQFGCLVKLWNKESGWRTNAANPSGAYGIPQALPGSKMASAGSDWRTSARTQIKWGLGYIGGRYGKPCDAWGHSQSVGWY